MKTKPIRLTAVILTVFFMFSGPAFAARQVQETQTAPLRFYDKELQKYINAPGIASDIHIDIQGTIARSTVTQYFVNDTQDWQEGIYTYPLPDNAAVDSLTMMIGDKRIIGFVHEKQQAKQIYEKAKAEGKAASLVKQHRPNIFKNSVANIPPRSVIAIEIQYQYPVSLKDYVFGLRMPMAITPRYNNFTFDDFMELAAAANQGWVSDALESRMTDAHLSNFEGGANPVSLSVSLTPGMEVKNLKSKSHKLSIEEEHDAYSISMAQKILPGEQDFTLSWEPLTQDKPIISAYQEELDGDIYSHLLILPPKNIEDVKAPAPKRQVTYILDTSGSMDGPSIKQARKSLVFALQDLNEDDFFNIIEFNSNHTVFYDRPQQGTMENIHQAIQRVGELEADGGTVMAPALQAAYNEKLVGDNYLRQIVFITDGAINYIDEMMEQIKKDGSNSRLFSIGIGAAPNSELMRVMAEAGRGTFTFIGDVSEIDETMSKLFRKMKTPALTNLELIIPDGVKGEIIPAVLPDLLAGEPVSIAMKTNKPLKRIDMHGDQGEKDFKLSRKLKDTTDAKGISKIYARRKIHELQFTDPYGSDESIKKTIINLGITHQIMSKYTSFVAVDEQTIRPDKAQLNTRQYDPSLPKGWQDGRLEGREASRLYQELLLKKQKEEAEGLKQNINLPQTATGYQLSLLLGLIMMLLGGLIFYRHQYGRRAFHA